MMIFEGKVVSEALILRGHSGIVFMEISPLIIDNYTIFAILQRISLRDF
jgi:hypothetical protein